MSYNQKVIKNPNLFRQPRIAHIRKRNLSEIRIYPKAEFIRKSRLLSARSMELYTVLYVQRYR